MRERKNINPVEKSFLENKAKITKAVVKWSFARIAYNRRFV